MKIKSSIIALLAFAVAIGVGASPQTLFSQAPGGAPAPVTAAKIRLEPPDSKRNFVGTVIPWRRAVIGAAVDGRVLEFPLRPGDLVGKEGVVAQLKTDTISREISLAEAEVKLRDAELSELQRSEDVDVAAANLAAARARMEFAETRRKRYEELYRQGQAITAEELDSVQSDAIAAVETFRSNQARLKGMTEGTRIDKIAQSRARLLIASEAVELLKTRKAKHTLRSPFAGVVTRTHTEIGAWLARSAAAVEVIDLSQVEIEFNVPDKYIARINVGDSVEMRFSGVPNEVYRKKISTIIPQGDMQTRTFPVRVKMVNGGDQPMLRAGMFCEVSVESISPPQLLVPKDALVLNDESTLIYVMTPTEGKPNEGIVKLVPVAVGEASGPYVHVTSLSQAMLHKDDLVIVGGNERLRPDQPVRRRETLATYPR